MSLRVLPLAALVLVVLALVASLALQHRKLLEARAEAAEASLTAANLAAQRDSTRDAALTHRALARVLGDSLRVVERQVVQAVQRADALDRALGGERRAAYSMYVRADSLHRVATAVGDNRSDTVVASVEHEEHLTFVVRQEPYTVHAAVTRRPPPDSARLALDIAMDSMAVDARISCGPRDAVGVRRATIDAVVPRWASVRFGRVEQAPGVCGGGPIGAGAARHFIEFRRVLVGAGMIRTVHAWKRGRVRGDGHRPSVLIPDVRMGCSSAKGARERPILVFRHPRGVSGSLLLPRAAPDRSAGPSGRSAPGGRPGSRPTLDPRGGLPHRVSSWRRAQGWRTARAPRGGRRPIGRRRGSRTRGDRPSGRHARECV